MKILGLVLTWNNFEFFKCALKQALDFCDEVVLIEGCHSRNYPRHSTDGTVEYLKSFSHSKLKILEPDWEELTKKHREYWKIQCAIFNLAIKSFSIWNHGAWIMGWPDDQFYFDKDLKKIRNILEKTDSDRVWFSCRKFIYNFRFNVLQYSSRQKGAMEINRLTPGCYYTPIHHLHYKNGRRYVQVNKGGRIPITMFHYSSVKKIERMNARCHMTLETPRRYTLSAGWFEKWMSVKWINDEDIFKYKDTLAFILSTDPERINIYKGRHPEVLDDHPWRNINDVRKI